MSWPMHHTESERFASAAEVALRQGDPARATDLYRLAAEAESRALDDLDQRKIRTIGITAVSTAVLFYKANDPQRAQRVAHQWLATGLLPPFAETQLHQLLQTIWSEELRRKTNVNFTKGEVLVSVSGGEVVYGAAPMDLIIRKVDEIRSLFYRTVELLLNLPLRLRGNPSYEIQQQCRPWLLQAAPGSYQFAVRIQQPDQLNLPGVGDVAPQIEQVTQKFLEIVQATAQDPQGVLIEVVPDEGYRRAFLQLTRNLAPTGKLFKQLEIRPAADLETRPIIFVPTSRDSINEAIRQSKSTKITAPVSDQVIHLRGVLRALDLDKDRIEITLLDKDTQDRVLIADAKEVIDDVIGPMESDKKK